MINNKFHELSEPKFTNIGWYVSTVEEIGDRTWKTSYYLHEDGKLYSSTMKDSKYTGYFTTCEDANAARDEYYRRAGDKPATKKTSAFDSAMKGV